MNVSKTRDRFDFCYTATDVIPIKQDDAKRLQLRDGYAPAGYGFYDFVCSKAGDLYTATWRCSNNCD